ncbi:ABC transporter substrate-binding protein [Nonomuraea sp. NPDC050451]|uniref:ABC transporter substrate-binding protein n=1 Tax=Nonomuraea sp. NPDC050451 TaxID=3364364 RepID=UPI0037AD9053
MSLIPRMRRTSLAIPILVAVGLVSGCVSENTDSPAAHGTSAPKTLRISATGLDSLPFMAIIQVAKDKGWFVQAGLNVSLFSGSGGGNTLRAVSTGDADVAIAGNTSVLLAATKPGSGLRIIAPWFQVNDFYWITPQTGVTLDKASLGFSGAGSTTELIVKALQHKYKGIAPVQVGQMGDNWAAAKASRISAGWAMHPFVTEKQEQEKARVLVASRDVIGDFPADLVAVSESYAKDNAAVLSTFFTVMDKTFKYVSDDPADAAKSLAPLIKVDAPVLERGLRQTPRLAEAYSLKVDLKALQRLSDLMVQVGQLDQPVDWKTTLDQQYLPADARTGL